MNCMADITSRIIARCRAMGFALAGVCDARPSEHEVTLREWLAAHKHGEMGYLQRHLELRLDPAKFVPEAKAVICVADRYAGETSKRPDVQASKRPIGRIARYARGKDYHRIMRDRLGKLSRELAREFPGERFRACVDTAPVLEREYAERAGIGAVGKNTMLIARGDGGSWLLLGEIITTLPLISSRSPDEAALDPCGTCTRCIDACPTQAISPDGWRLDATRCISYLTIEHQSLIDARFHEAMGDWIFGCDICQEVCPHNQGTAATRHLPVHPAYEARREGFDLLEMLNWTEADREQAVINSAMKRARLEMLKRNAMIAAGNVMRSGHASAELRQAIGRLAGEGCDTLVQETAKSVTQGSQRSSAGAKDDQGRGF
jgi:epoxyqueuosine reductase